MIRSVRSLLVAVLGLGVVARAGAQAPPPLAFKVTSVHFSKAVESQLQGVVTPREVTEAWQKALARNAKFRVIGFDEAASNAEFGGALLAASATVTKTDVYRIAIGEKGGGYSAALVALTATFLDPGTGEVFFQDYIEVSSPPTFLPLFDQERDIDIKDLSKYYQAVPESSMASYAKSQYHSLVLSGLEKLAADAAKKYQPAVEEGKVLGQWKAADGADVVAVNLGFQNGLVRGSIVRIYNPREQEKPVSRAAVLRVEQDRSVCRVLDVAFAREIREGFPARAIGPNKLSRPKPGTLVLQVTGFGGKEHPDYADSFHIDEDVDSMWLSDALSQGGEFFMLAPLPSVSAVADTAEFAEGVEVAEEEIFGRRRIADVGVKGNFFKASIVREVQSSDKLRKMGRDVGTRLHQELELRLGLEFYDLYTGQLLFTSETKRVQELVDELYDSEGNQVTDVSEEAGFRRLSRSLIREAAQDARKRFRSDNLSAKVASADGSTLTLDLPAGAKVNPRTVLVVWHPGQSGGAISESFPQRLGVATVDQVQGQKATAHFVPAKGVQQAPAKGDEAQGLVSGPDSPTGSDLPVVQVEKVDMGEGLDSHMQLAQANLVELMHVALGTAPGVQAVPPAYRAVELEKDAQLFRDGDYNLEQAEKMLSAKVHAVDFRLRGRVESAGLAVRKEGGTEVPVFTLKMRVQLVDPSGKVVAEAAASGERKPNAGAATIVRGGRVVEGVREEDYPQEFEYLAKDLLDKLVPHVVKKGLTPGSEK